MPIAVATFTDGIGGAALGILIGIVSGIAAMLLILTAMRLLASNQSVSVKDVVTVITELLSIPTFWFGGPWLMGSMLHYLHMDLAAPYYTTTLAIAFGTISSPVLFRMVNFTKNQFPKRGHRP